MLVVENLSKRFETKTILQDVSFTLNRGERTALFGVNGTGKTTLFRILNAEEKADSGAFHFVPPSLPRCYLPQNRSFRPDATLESVLGLTQTDRVRLEAEIEKVSLDLSQCADDDQLQARFDSLLNQLQLSESNTDDLQRLLKDFGLSQFPLDTPVSNLSGGQRTCLALAAALSSSSELLMLDEPTNDLDEQMLHTLEELLLDFRGAVLYVSHDRAFLDRTATKIMELDRNTHKLKIYDGNYQYWCERKAAEEQAELAAWTRQQDEIERLKAASGRKRDEAVFKRGGKADTADKFAKAFFANRGKNTLKRATTVEKRLDKLLGEDRAQKPGENWKMKMDHGELAETGNIVLSCSDLSVGYGEKLIRSDLNFTLKSGMICALTGPNGSGKSTLIKTICGELEPLAGKFRIGSGVQIGYLPQGARLGFIKENALESIQSVSGLNETEARRILSFYLFFGDDAFIPVDGLSNGQIARLTLAGFSVMGKNFLVLDEPLNHLDIESREQFEEALRQFPGTALVVAHDRYFVERTADIVWAL